MFFKKNCAHFNFKNIGSIRDNNTNCICFNDNYNFYTHSFVKPKVTISQSINFFICRVALSFLIKKMVNCLFLKIDQRSKKNHGNRQLLQSNFFIFL